MLKTYELAKEPVQLFFSQHGSPSHDTTRRGEVGNAYRADLSKLSKHTHTMFLPLWLSQAPRTSMKVDDLLEDPSFPPGQIVSVLLFIVQVLEGQESVL